MWTRPAAKSSMSSPSSSPRPRRGATSADRGARMDTLISFGPMLQSALVFALLQSLWQGALLGLGAAVSLTLMSRRSAAARHAVAMVFLGAMLLLPAWSFVGALSGSPDAGLAVSGAARASAPVAALPA